MTLNQWLTCTDPAAMLGALGEQADERRCKILVEECRKKWDITGKREWNQDVFRWRVVAKSNWINQSVADRTNDWMAGIMRCIWPPPMMERERVECESCKTLGTIVTGRERSGRYTHSQCPKCKGKGFTLAPLINPRYRTPLVMDLARRIRGAVCRFCGKSAGCFGAYEGIEEGFSCDECCGHGNEDGWCDGIGEDYKPNPELMPILADALMDAGADNEEVLNHLRCEHHVAGYCWVIGMLLEQNSNH